MGILVFVFVALWSVTYIVYDVRRDRLLLAKATDSTEELQPSLTTVGAIAVCEKCGGATGCEASLYGLVHAELEHALECNGTMRLTKDGKDPFGSLPPPKPSGPVVRLTARERRAQEAMDKAQRHREFVFRLIPPDAGRVGIRPSPPPFGWARCTGAGGCGYHHRKGIPCGQALNERRPPPPMPTRDPGRGTLAQS